MGVGLIAIAAIVASLSVARRQDVPRPAEGEKRPQLSPVSGTVDLDQLRAAGM